MYHVFKGMTLRQLLDYRLVSPSNRDLVDNSYVWCDRLQRDFGITSTVNCFETYKQEYKNRREDNAETVAYYFGIFTPWHIVKKEQEEFLPKDSLSVTAASMGRIFSKVIDPMKAMKMARTNGLRMTRKDELIILGITPDMLSSFSPKFRSGISTGIIMRQNDKTDVLPDIGLNLLTSAWGGDMDQSREYKVNYVTSKQQMYAKELYDDAVKRQDIDAKMLYSFFL